MNNTAYLVVWLSGTEAKYMGIYSAPPWGLTSLGHRVPALLYQVQGDSFDQASKIMLSVLERLGDQHPVHILWKTIGRKEHSW